MHWRQDVERAFERWADLVLRHPSKIVLACVLLVAVLATGIPRLGIETSFESYLPRENLAKQRYDRFREEFGTGERVVLLLEPETIYDTRFLAELAALHDALAQQLPYLDDITSLVNARTLRGTAELLISEDLVDELPQSEAGLQRLRDRVRSNPLYRNVVVSSDESATAIIIELDGALGPSSESDRADEGGADLGLEGFGDDSTSGEMPPTGSMLTTEQSEVLVGALDRIIDEFGPTTARLSVAGTPLLAHRIGRMMTKDIALFVSVSLAFSALLLFLLFRSGWATVHPLIVVVLSVVGTLGWMGWAGVPITAVTEILPSLLIAVGVGDAVHIQTIVFKNRECGLDPPEAIRMALGHSGLAVLLTSVTTAASMAAFRAADLQPVIDLGRAAPIGIGIALLLSVSLLPALLSFTPLDARHQSSGARAAARRADRVLLALGRLGTRHPRIVLAVVAGVSLLALHGTTSLRFSQDDLRWLPEDDPIRVATEALNRTMGGAEPFELVVRVDPTHDLREPAVLAALEEIEDRIGSLRVGQVSVAQNLSLVDAIEETHRALGDDPAAPLVLPSDRAVVSQELLLFESAAPDDFARLVGPGGRTTRIAMSVPFVDAIDYPRFARASERIAADVLSERGLGDHVTVSPTGLLMLAGETFDLLLGSMVRSYAIAFGVIGLLMVLLIGDVRLGLLTLFPNVVPILLILGFMQAIDAPLDVSSMLVGGILIGVVVDDTIHFAHNFARYREETGCALRAIRETLTTTGRAMLVTSITLSIGFLAFTGASLSNVAAFGMLCGLGVVLAFVADVVMMPALVAAVAPCAESCRGHRLEPLAVVPAG